MSLASRIGKLEAALAAMALGAAGGVVVAWGPSNASAADLEAQWAAQLAALGLSLDTAPSLSVVLVHRVQFSLPGQSMKREKATATAP